MKIVIRDVRLKTKLVLERNVKRKNQIDTRPAVNLTLVGDIIGTTATVRSNLGVHSQFSDHIIFAVLSLPLIGKKPDATSKSPRRFSKRRPSSTTLGISVGNVSEIPSIGPPF